MHKVTLGKNGPKVARLGLGCMGMSDFYSPKDRDETRSIKTIHAALDTGLNLIDTADMYGPFTNEELVGRALKGCREKAILATKFGNERRADGSFVGINGTPAYVRAACDASLRRLGVECIDIYYQHRVDVNVPIEDTVGAMAELVKLGKVRFLGLSEASPATIRRAHAVHPITAVQTEYSLWCRDVEVELLATLRGLDIALVAYSPLGRGFLTGTIASTQALPEGDYRRQSPKFMGEQLQHNLQLVDVLQQVATKLKCTPAQVALAWLLAQGNDVVPIFGTRTPERVQHNAEALQLRLTPQFLDKLDLSFFMGAAKGDRYSDMSTVNR